VNFICFIRTRVQLIKNDREAYVSYFKKLGVVGCVVSLFVVFCYFLLIGPHFMLAVNESNSLPQTFFLVVKGAKVKVGDDVAFYPPDNPLYGSKYPFLKIVGGVPGDVVSRVGREFFVNGQDKGWAYRKAHNGKVLNLGPTGVLGRDEYYVYTPHPKSYDSRYKSIGWIKASHIVGRAYPLF
jgi:conjugal transfer pilin signal peptidase TrbI